MPCFEQLFGKLFEQVTMPQVVVIGMQVVGELHKLEQEDEWNPETKFGPFMAPPYSQITPN